MTGPSKALFVAAIIIMLTPASAKDGAKQTTTKQNGTYADKNTKDTSKNTKGKRDPIIDFIQKPSSINPSMR